MDTAHGIRMIEMLIKKHKENRNHKVVRKYQLQLKELKDKTLRIQLELLRNNLKDFQQFHRPL